jgi:predicted enzyme related to lactoylglutathione lyase
MDVLASRFLLTPSDFARSRRFYEHTLGLAVFREFGDETAGGVVFYTGAGLLEVSGQGGPPPAASTRLLLQVRDVTAEWQRLIDAGVDGISAPERKPWGLIEAAIRDPDGLQIVLVEVPPDHRQRRG